MMNLVKMYLLMKNLLKDIVITEDLVVTLAEKIKKLQKTKEKLLNDPVEGIVNENNPYPNMVKYI